MPPDFHSLWGDLLLFQGPSKASLTMSSNHSDPRQQSGFMMGRPIWSALFPHHVRAPCFFPRMTAWQIPALTAEETSWINQIANSHLALFLSQMVRQLSASLSTNVDQHCPVV